METFPARFHSTVEDYTMGWNTTAVCNRWFVNINEWDPCDGEWDFLLSLLPEAEEKAVMRYKLVADRKRALISRLLQWRCATVALDIPYDDIVIKRTKGRKPFVANKTDRKRAPNFNFNVSHEGDYVVLASEPLCICGIDVAAPQQLRMRGKEQTMSDIHKIFNSSFTENEWRCILGGGTEEEQKILFRRHWSLKEAFVKARGDGIAFDLCKAEFSFKDGCWGDTAQVKVNGILQPKWKFSLHGFPGGHWVSVARGPPLAIVDANGEFTATLESKDFEHRIEEYKEAIDAPAPPFQELTAGHLVPRHRIDEYMKFGGVILIKAGTAF